MATGLRPYPEYKPSDVPKIAEIPVHWISMNLRRMAHVQLSNVDKHSVAGEIPVELCNYTDVYNRSTIDSDIEFMKATADLREIAKFALHRGDVLITKDSESWEDIAVSSYVAADLPNVLCGYHLAQIRPRTEITNGAYLYRAFQAEPIAYQFRVAARGVTRYGIAGNDIASAIFPVPPLNEQAAIVRFLDHADRRIRRYIRAKRKLIALLNEQKQIIIQRAVTRGLDPNVPLKPSGVEWLGDIPAHWDMQPLKRVAAIQSGITLGKKYLNRELVQYPYLRVANVQEGYLALEHVKTIAVPEAEARLSLLQTGDVLMTEGGDPDKLGRGYVWEGQIDPCLHQNHIFAVRPSTKRLMPFFLAATLSTRYAKTFFLRRAKQTTNLASTNKTTIGQLPIVLPPVSEQESLMQFLERKTSYLERGIENTLQEIDAAREYRTRLIADVVTGKLDVREAARRLPDEIDDAGEGDVEPLDEEFDVEEVEEVSDAD